MSDLLISRRRWVHGALWLTAGNVVATALSAIAAIVIGRVLGPAGFGLYSLVVVVVGFGATLASFRLEMHLITRLRSSPDDIEVIQDVLRTGWVLALLFVTAGLLAGLVLNLAAPLVVVLAAGEVVLSPLMLGRAVLQRQARQRALVASSLCGRLVWVGLVVVVAVARPGSALVLVLAARVISLGAEMAMVWHLAGVPIAPTVLPRLLAPRRHVATIRAALPLAVSGLAGTAYNRADQLILGVFRGRQETGLYAAGVRVAELIGTVAPIVDNVTLPALVELDRRRDELGFVKAVRDSALMMTVPAGIVVGMLLTAGSDIVPFLFGSDYELVGPTVGLLAVAEWATLLGLVGCSTALARGYRGVLLRSTLAGLVVNTLANAVLIPPFGGVGAAWASIVGYGVASAYVYCVPGLRDPLRAAASVAARVLTAILASWGAGQVALPLVGRLAIVALVYLSVLAVLVPNDIRRVLGWVRSGSRPGGSIRRG